MFLKYLESLKGMTKILSEKSQLKQLIESKTVGDQPLDLNN